MDSDDNDSITAKDSNITTMTHAGEGGEARLFNYLELEKATNMFSAENVLGQGGSGIVYRGDLPNGEVVAIKLINPNGFKGIEQFKEEVLMLHHLRHPNIVTIKGYCCKGEQPAILYEYVPFGSLEDVLHGDSETPLDWKTRLLIATGAAKGISYLHHDVKPAVIHRDIKTSNILLGKEYFPKIADFGIVKLAPSGDRTLVTKCIMGTPGYCAPEYETKGWLTVKADVYSFGIVLLELLTGRKSMIMGENGREEPLSVWASQELKNILTMRREFPDPKLGKKFSLREFRKILYLASTCLLANDHSRPTMERVVQDLIEASTKKREEGTSTLRTSGIKSSVASGSDSLIGSRSLSNKNDEARLIEGIAVVEDKMAKLAVKGEVAEEKMTMLGEKGIVLATAEHDIDEGSESD